jgi:hypothetical protein
VLVDVFVSDEQLAHARTRHARRWPTAGTRSERSDLGT